MAEGTRRHWNDQDVRLWCRGLGLLAALSTATLSLAVGANGARTPNPRLHSGNPALHTAPAGAPDPYRPRLHHGNPANHLGSGDPGSGDPGGGTDPGSGGDTGTATDPGTGGGTGADPEVGGNPGGTDPAHTTAVVVSGDAAPYGSGAPYGSTAPGQTLVTTGRSDNSDAGAGAQPSPPVIRFARGVLSVRRIGAAGYVTVRASVDRGVQLVVSTLDRRGRLLTFLRGSVVGSAASGKPHSLLKARIAGPEALRIVLRFNWATLTRRGSRYRIRLDATDDQGLSAVGVATLLRI